jgi:flagellar L-ring protein precursor FlgH
MTMSTLLSYGAGILAVLAAAQAVNAQNNSLYQQAARPQSNSLFLQAGQAQQTTPPDKPQTWPTASVPIVYGMAGHENRSLQSTSLFAVQLPAPRVFKVHDTVTVVIREQRQYKHDADLETKKDFDIAAKMTDWFRIHDKKWQQQTFPNGKPQIGGTYSQNLKDSGQTQRSDELLTRMTVEIIDIKPNNTLVLKGQKLIKTDEEEQRMLLTGICRAEDVGPDNTILSTQINDLVVDAQSKGAVKDATRRGWLGKLLDKGKAF